MLILSAIESHHRRELREKNELIERLRIDFKALEDSRKSKTSKTSKTSHVKRVSRKSLRKRNHRSRRSKESLKTSEGISSFHTSLIEFQLRAALKAEACDSDPQKPNLEPLKPSQKPILEPLKILGSLGTYSSSPSSEKGSLEKIIKVQTLQDLPSDFKDASKSSKILSLSGNSENKRPEKNSLDVKTEPKRSSKKFFETSSSEEKLRKDPSDQKIMRDLSLNVKSEPKSRSKEATSVKIFSPSQMSEEGPLEEKDYYKNSEPNRSSKEAFETSISSDSFLEKRTLRSDSDPKSSSRDDFETLVYFCWDCGSTLSKCSCYHLPFPQPSDLCTSEYETELIYIQYTNLEKTSETTSRDPDVIEIMRPQKMIYSRSSRDISSSSTHLCSTE